MLNHVSHLVLLFKSEPGEPPGSNNWNNCLQASKQASKQTHKHTPYWEDKSLRPYGATKNSWEYFHRTIFWLLVRSSLDFKARGFPHIFYLFIVRIVADKNQNDWKCSINWRWEKKFCPKQNFQKKTLVKKSHKKTTTKVCLKTLTTTTEVWTCNMYNMH